MNNQSSILGRGIKSRYTVAVILIIGLVIGAFWYRTQVPVLEDLRLVAAATGVKTDMGVYPVGTPPSLPAAGGVVEDPVFGTEVMRITDANTAGGAGFNTAYSYWPSFNANNTRILAIETNTGNPRIFTFDPNNFTLASNYVPASGVGSYEWAAIWSHLNPDFMYGTSGASIKRYSVTTNTWTTLHNLSSTFPNRYFFQISLSSDDDVMAFTLKNSSNYSVEGYAVVRVSTGQVLYQQATSELDEVQIDKSGRYLVVKTGSQGAGVVEVRIVDLQATPTPTVTDLIDNNPDNAPGHSDNGSNFIVGHANFIDAITARTLSNPHSYTTLIQDGTWTWLQSQHISMLAEDEDWALISQYGSIANQPLNNEIWFLKTDGSGEKRRILHHYSVYSDYSTSPRANISLNGEFVAFTSNWGNSNGRLDMFVARVPDFGSIPPPADTTPPVMSGGSPSGTQASGTTSVNMAMATDEIATCKYGTTSDQSYASKSNTFSTTNSTSHSTIITGLTNGTSYNYYVRCQDGSSNTNTSDLTISFSVATAGGGGSSGGGGGGGGSTPNSPSTTSTTGLINASGTFYLLSEGYRKGVTSPGIMYSCGFEFKDARTATATDLSLPSSLLLPCGGALVKSQQDQTVYLISSGKRYAFTSAAVFLGLGFKFSSVLLVTNPELQALPQGDNLSNPTAAHLPEVDININGTIYWLDTNFVKHAYPSLEIYNSWHRDGDFTTVVPANSNDLNLTTGPLVSKRF